MRTITTPEAPAAVGPYSQAVVHGDVVYCSGQIPLDPRTGALVAGGVDAQARRVLDNLAAVLRAAGSGLPAVVRTTIYLTDVADFAAVNAVYADAFGAHRPARSTVEVAALPLGAGLEIDCVAVVGGAGG